MPLSPLATDTPEQLEKAEKVREKIFHNYQSKYLFKIQPCHMPVDMIEENDRLAGLVFQKTKIENERVVPIPGSETAYRSPLVVSSIGSIPEVIDGIPMKGQVYRVNRDQCCRIDGFSQVFALGNAVTGRGNINESLKHGRNVSVSLVENYLPEDKIYEKGYQMARSRIAENIEEITNVGFSRLKAPSEEDCRNIQARVKELHDKVGYNGNYEEWIAEHLPVRLEELLGGEH